ncbi:hypothetical protein [Pusillimonas noertemannii]|uniref:hypothetical protein n=1 Tax=Pusillimonas noertemannii TaxID=305977 RepID=UPI0010577C34|nr:hypothetical protein [Pusillimonas noertemannii]NYT68165.1 hypothetical protein [Pusillimonas noertemannii]TFL11705.1 hypothetical protein CSC72_00805 [Pusillimonas noertemannii]
MFQLFIKNSCPTVGIFQKQPGRTSYESALPNQKPMYRAVTFNHERCRKKQRNDNLIQGKTLVHLKASTTKGLSKIKSLECSAKAAGQCAGKKAEAAELLPIQPPRL